MPGLYSIPLAGLKEARYTYDFKIGDDFFEAFEESEVKRGEFTSVVVLQKSTTHLELDIVINGRARITSYNVCYTKLLREEAGARKQRC